MKKKKKNPGFAFVARMSESDRKSLDDAAARRHIKSTLLVRCLIHYILDEKITFTELIAKTNGLKGGKIPPKGERRDLRTSVERPLEIKLRNFAESWDASPGFIATKLVQLYVAKEITDSDL
jgi:hypothetical protein